MEEPEQTKPSFSDVYELVSKKILINKMSIENLNLQIKFSKLSIDVQQAAVIQANKKIELAKQLNQIFELQLKDFTEERQNECINIYYEINMLDKPTEEYMTKYKELEKTEKQLLQISEKITMLERTIPNETIITKYLHKGYK